MGRAGAWGTFLYRPPENMKGGGAGLIKVISLIPSRTPKQGRNDGQKGHDSMIICKRTIGTGKRRRTVYDLENTAQDTGRSYGNEIGRFPSLELAALVMRYMTGAELTEADTIRAKDALTKADEKGAADSLATTATP